jgi:hypothetical protein
LETLLPGISHFSNRLSFDLRQRDFARFSPPRERLVASCGLKPPQMIST